MFKLLTPPLNNNYFEDSKEFIAKIKGRRETIFENWGETISTKVDKLFNGVNLSIEEIQYIVK